MKRTKQDALTRRLKTTAIAAGAALAGGVAADAAVIGHTINETVGPNESFLLDLDGDGTNDFEFNGSTSFTSTSTSTPDGSTTFVTTTSAYASVAGLGDNRVLASGRFARVFSASESISAGAGDTAPFASLTSSFSGPFAGSTPKYLGLVFNTTDYGVVNGWARVAVPDGGEIFIESYAFETDGSPIHVPNEVPEPSTLLLMASGAAGLIALRRRRKS